MGGEHTFESIDGAATSLEAMVNAVDVATLSGPGATRLARRLVTCERVLAGCRSQAMKRAADANQWRTAGERSPGAWAAKVTGTTLGQANAELETAAKLELLPATAAARASGELSELQAKEIAGAATADPAAEAELLRRAKVDDAAALKRRCAAVRAAAQADEAAARERIRKERRFKWWTDAEGAFCFSGRGLAEDGAALLAAMKRYQDRAFHTARRAGAHEPAQAYAYDALMAMARHDAAHQCAPATAGAGSKSAASAITGSAPPAGPTRDTGTTGSTGSPGTSATAATSGTAPPTGSTPNIGTTGSTGTPGSGPTAGTTGATPDTNGRSATSTTEEPGGRAGPSTTTGTPTVPRHAGDPPGSTPTDTSRRNGAAGRATTCASTATLFDTPAQAGTEATGARAGPEPPDIDADRDEILAECFKPGPGPKFIVHIDHSALVRGHTVPGERCEIAGIGPIDVASARQLARDAFLAAVVTDGIDIRSVVHLGRAATAHQRTALEARGIVCAVPGCGMVHGLEIDHVDGWAITRRTQLDQLDWLCTFHHGQKTHKSYRLAGPPGNRTWHPPGEAPDTG